MKRLFAALLGYVVGSMPFALAIGKVYYRTDVRQHGSGNLGGSNTGRVLGKQAGLAVVTLDLLKATQVVYLSGRLFDHPWAVATFYGFLFGLWGCEGCSPPVIFLLVLFCSKIVAPASMSSALVGAICIGLAGTHPSMAITAGAFALLVVVRHRENIKRMVSGSENKIRWM